MKKILLFLTIFSILSITAFADSANIGGTGNTIEILDNNEIQMVNETIIIEITKENNEESVAKVSVNYTFKNTTDQPVDVKMGFPEVCDGTCFESSEYYTEDFQTTYHLHNFMASDNSEALEITFKNDAEAETEGTNWYLFNVNFDADEEKEIQNTYWMYPSSYKSGARWFDYILETGSSWKDSIENIDIYVTFKGALSLYDVDDIAPDDFIFDRENNTIKWHITNLEPSTEDNINIHFIDPTEEDFSCMLSDPEYYETDDFYGGGEASSYLPSDSEFSYYPCKAYDNNPETAWVEGKEDSGAGEILKIPLDSNKVYEKVKILNGYGTNEEIWEKNNRIKKAKLYFSTGHEQIIELSDTYSYQTIDLNQKIRNPEFAQLIIFDVYSGTSFDDTSLSEIHFLGLLPEDGVNTEPGFSDISGHYLQESIEFIKSRGIVDGYPDGSYKPYNKINRAELTKIIVEAVFPGQAEGANCFPDVTTDWYAPYVCFAKEKNIVSGYPDNTFKPEEYVNYVEALKIALEAFNLVSDQKTEPWYQVYVDKALEIKVGVADIWYEALLKRGEMAELITRILKYQEEGPDSEYLN